MARWLRFDVVARAPRLPWELIVVVLALRPWPTTRAFLERA